MPFKDFTEFADPLRLPHNGTLYEIPPMGIRDGIRLTQVLDPETEDTLTDDEFLRMLLGEALDKMTADNVPRAFVTRCALTALADFQAGRLAAEGIWETGADPKALEAWVGKQQTDSAAPATTTPPPASTSSTTPKRTTKKAA